MLYCKINWWYVTWPLGFKRLIVAFAVASRCQCWHIAVRLLVWRTAPLRLALAKRRVQVVTISLVCVQLGGITKHSGALLLGGEKAGHAVSWRIRRTPFHILASHLLCVTYSMLQCPWEANRFSASQEIPHILWNPKVHHRVHKRPTAVLVLSQRALD